jgi:hypothetical protein
VFWDPLVTWLAKNATREDTVGEIARRFGELVVLFEKNQALQTGEASSKAIA